MKTFILREIVESEGGRFSDLMAEGVIFEDGKVVVNKVGNSPLTVVCDSIEDFINLMVKNDKGREILYHSDPVLEKSEKRKLRQVLKKRQLIDDI